MEFLKGNTDPVGDCCNFAAGIDVHGADQFPNDSKKRTWYSRIECYGNTAKHAEELRDKVLALLVAPTPPQPIHDEVYDLLAATSLEAGQKLERLENLLRDVEHRILRLQAQIPMSRRESAMTTKIRADIKRHLGVIK